MVPTMVASRPAQQDGELRVLPASALKATQLHQVAEVYEQCFPAHLRVPFAPLATETQTDLMLVALADSLPVGFAANMRLGDAGWTFLRYYGVAASRRRQGLGLRFWRLVLPALAHAGWPVRVVFEVEDPRPVDCDPAEQRVRTGRIGFWESCGARLLDIDGYVMPDLTGLAGPEPMLLMACSGNENRLTPDQTAELVTALYGYRYGLRSGHPMVTNALASIRR